MSSLDVLVARLLGGDEEDGSFLSDLTKEVRIRVVGLDGLLAQLQGFESASEAEQLEALDRLEQDRDPAFAALVVAAHEFFYADQRSWRALGYTTRLPGRP